MSNYQQCKNCYKVFPQDIEGIDIINYCPNCGSDYIGLLEDTVTPEDLK